MMSLHHVDRQQTQFHCGLWECLSRESQDEAYGEARS